MYNYFWKYTSVTFRYEVYLPFFIFIFVSRHVFIISLVRGKRRGEYRLGTHEDGLTLCVCGMCIPGKGLSMGRWKSVRVEDR